MRRIRPSKDHAGGEADLCRGDAFMGSGTGVLGHVCNHLSQARSGRDAAGAFILHPLGRRTEGRSVGAVGELGRQRLRNGPVVRLPGQHGRVRRGGYRKD